MKRIANVNELRVNDIPYVGGKGANLGELTAAGFPVPDAFVLTTAAYDYFLEKSKITPKIKKELSTRKKDSDQSLTDASVKVRALFEQNEIPTDLKKEILEAYRTLFPEGKKGFVAVRSSATAEDLPDASFAGQQETFLNVSTPEDLLDKVRKCWSSLFTARAISYREKQGFEHDSVKLAVVVQRMVNSEMSGIMFTVDPHSGKDEIIVEAGFGLGEAIVGGEVTPDTYVINKRIMEINKKRIAAQKWKYIKGADGSTIKADIPKESQKAQKIEDKFIIEVASIGRQIEIHYERPMDVEWCIENSKVYIVQARPITAVGESAAGTSGEAANAEVLATGLGASPGVAAGTVKFYDEGMSLDIIKKGDILVTTMTMPDMVPAMSRAVAIVTDEGGMTCHAAIISRELGIPCIVGTGDGTNILRDGMVVTVDGSSGTVYDGDSIKNNERKGTEPVTITAPSVPVTGTKVFVNLSMPNKAEEVAKLPVSGVGLMRIEFLFTSYVGEHPLHVIAEGRSEDLVNKLAEGIGIVARAFYPRPVILRTSDFKTNEYRDMKGGIDYEPMESNPMIGWRGCSRYVSDKYREAFMCELRAIKKVRNEMGLKNLWMMLPFVRTIEEAEDIAEMMRSVGLKRSRDFKLYFMAEVPVNIFMADQFCQHCDAFSIGSNDLTQLIMGADRDSDILGRMGYFDERNDGVKRAISHLIKVAHEHGKEVCICGQAPSVYPEFTEFLVQEGIDGISLNPDTVIKTKSVIASAEQRVLLQGIRGRRTQ
ncbi:MAG: phosphoenolpyruvate synthase [Methanomassiliicoccaceae archaeon]|jgi:pyruvate,water dikinase|nr:phosphoenolpyruvate synthase [Methanomassiliicoccaceae archaeon]